VNRRSALVALSTAALLAWMPAAEPAEPIDVLQVSLEPSADGDAWLLSADFTLTLTQMLEEAVNRGLPLVFVTDFELLRPRWYWRDETTSAATRMHRLSYHALTRQYRVQVDGSTAVFATLPDALESIARLRGWRVMPRDRVRPDTTYEGWIRLRLDPSHLPKPFQLTALTDKDWNLQSTWKRFIFTPPKPRSDR
jgi:hypothetical protein